MYEYVIFVLKKIGYLQRISWQPGDNKENKLDSKSRERPVKQMEQVKRPWKNTVILGKQSRFLLGFSQPIFQGHVG